MSIDPATVVAIITALAGLAVALATRRKTDAETAKASTEAVLILIRPLSERVAALEGEVATLRSRVAEFRRGVRILCGQVRQLGAEPLWEPPMDGGDDD
jgi:hypothetical protein